MYRDHTCGELTAKHIGTEVILSGWVQKVRDKGFICWVDLRDRYGITQLIFDAERSDETMVNTAKNLGRETVISVRGTVIKRDAANPKMATGAIEILVNDLNVLNVSKTPPFTIEDETDGGDEYQSPAPRGDETRCRTLYV